MHSCPFCGSEHSNVRVWTSVEEDVKLHVYVECDVCHAHGPVKATKQEAVDSWNRRGE